MYFLFCNLFPNRSFVIFWYIVHGIIPLYSPCHLPSGCSLLVTHSDTEYSLRERKPWVCWCEREAACQVPASRSVGQYRDELIRLAPAMHQLIICYYLQCFVSFFLQLYVIIFTHIHYEIVITLSTTRQIPHA